MTFYICKYLLRHTSYFHFSEPSSFTSSKSSIRQPPSSILPLGLLLFVSLGHMMMMDGLGMSQGGYQKWHTVMGLGLWQGIWMESTEFSFGFTF
jgi:hypothetical protein